MAEPPRTARITSPAPPPPPQASASNPPLVTFGTYNYTHDEILEDATNQAMYLLSHYKKVPLIDTAMKYKNLPIILKALERNSDARIGWKVEHPRVNGSASFKVLGPSQFRPSKVVVDSKAERKEALAKKESKEEGTYVSPKKIKVKYDGLTVLDHPGKGKTLNGKNMYDGMAVLKASVPKTNIFRILLHNYCGKEVYLEFQHLVEQEFGADIPIGVCNITADQLEDLMQSRDSSDVKNGEEATTTDNQVRVDWVQNEYHPFLETHVPEVCRKFGIRFEAHSVMTNLAGYADLFKRLSVSNSVVSAIKSAELALKYAAKQGGVCFTTANFSHLKQDLQTLLNPQVDDEDDALLSAMSHFSSFERIVRYKGVETGAKVDWVKACDPVQIHEEILPKLKKDIAAFEAGKPPSNLCIQIPKSWRAGGKVHGILAEMLYGGNLECQMVELRRKLQQKMMRKVASEHAENGGNNEGIGNSNTAIADEDLKSRLEAKWSLALHVLLVKMRRCIDTAQAAQRANAKKAPNPVQAVEQPEALPMDGYPEAGEFADLIQFLKTGGTSAFQDGNEELPVNIRFKFGTINSDGRLDLCKQGFRNAFSDSCDVVIQDGRKELPVNIRFKHGTVNSDGRLDLCKQGFRNAFSESCEAVNCDKQNQADNSKKSLIKHYLIGNNRIGEDGDIPGEGNRRVAALARLIKHRPDVVTWYLAGNSMDDLQIRSVAEALEQTRAKYVWFKMNPVKTGAYHLGKLLVRNPHIELLDLFNCGLCNHGFAAFARGLAEEATQNPASPRSNIRHLYLSINAIDSAWDLQKTLGFLPRLESLFLGMNPFGDKGLKEIAEGIIHEAPCRQVLKRLNMGSMGLTDASLPLIENIVTACPNLVSLELDSYKSTNYFDQKYNRFDVGNVTTRARLVGIARALVQNARRTPGKDEGTQTALMHYLGLQFALVVGASPGTRTATAAQAKAILDDFVENQLNGGTGINVNGITNIFPCKGGMSYRHVGERKVSVKGDLSTLDMEQICEGREDEEKGALSKLLCIDGSDTRAVGGGVVFAKGVTMADLRVGVKHPWPALDHIKSIYRNTMKA